MEINRIRCGLICLWMLMSVEWVSEAKKKPNDVYVEMKEGTINRNWNILNSYSEQKRIIWSILQTLIVFFLFIVWKKSAQLRVEVSNTYSVVFLLSESPAVACVWSWLIFFCATDLFKWNKKSVAFLSLSPIRARSFQTKVCYCLGKGMGLYLTLRMNYWWYWWYELLMTTKQTK